MSNSSIWPIDRTLSGATTSDQSEPGIEGNESSSIIGASPSDCLMLYPGHSLGWVGSYSSAEIQSVNSTVSIVLAANISDKIKQDFF